MGSEPENKNFEFIEHWLESVSEGTSITTNSLGTQQQQYLQPAHPPLSHSPITNTHYLKHTQNMAGKKRAGPSQEDAPPAAKRPSTRQSTAARSNILFSETDTHSKGSHSVSHSHATSISTRLQRDRLQYASPPIDLLPPESKNKPEAVTQLFSDLMDKLEDAVPLTLR